jgi:hypothetical protein
MQASEGRVTRWLSIVSNFSVLLGLLFVGVEVRNSRASVKAQAADGIADGFVQLNLAIITDTMVARVWEQGTRAPETLTEGERFQFAMHIRGLFNQYIRVYRFYRAGLISEDEWAFYAPEIAAQLGTPGGVMFFSKNTLPLDFLADVRAHEDSARQFDTRIGPSNPIP